MPSRKNLKGPTKKCKTKPPVPKPVPRRMLKLRWGEAERNGEITGYLGASPVATISGGDRDLVDVGTWVWAVPLPGLDITTRMGHAPTRGAAEKAASACVLYWLQKSCLTARAQETAEPETGAPEPTDRRSAPNGAALHA